MHTISDWASFHSSDLETIKAIVQAYGIRELRAVPAGFSMPPAVAGVRVTEDLHGANRHFVVPAIVEVLDPDDALGLRERLLEVGIADLDPESGSPPHALLDERTGKPLIAMAWRNSIADLVCLAHEIAHSAHIILSDTDRMPPVARETCAFLGELMLLSHLRERNAGYFAGVLSVWLRENDRYLGSDLAILRNALTGGDALYHYRLNYPIARLAAVHIFDCPHRARILRALFSSGSGAMAHVPLDELASRGNAMENCLPPFPESTPAALTTYRSLGAMALLDISASCGASMQDIAGYYALRRDHLRQRTALVASCSDRRPIGYALWRENSEANTVTLAYQAAPFGDHLMLQRTLRHLFGKDFSVLARSSRSASQEQFAW